MSLSWSECKKNKEQELDIFSKLTNVIESKTIFVLVLSYFLASKRFTILLTISNVKTQCFKKSYTKQHVLSRLGRQAISQMVLITNKTILTY